MHEFSKNIFDSHDFDHMFMSKLNIAPKMTKLVIAEMINHT